MKSEVRRGLVLVACVSVGFVISAGPGLVARAAEPDRWVEALTQSAATAVATHDAAQRRIVELEQRVKDLEAERGRAQQGAPKPAELAAAIARNEELAARNRALTVENQELAQSRLFVPSAAASTAPPPASDADAREQLRYWAKQIRDGETAFRRIPADWNAAVNVLLRNERQLDPNNPWREQ
ncbi:MAG TPA: hypothetical protein VMG12_44765 [Polyangiaceae bacterium]|nr:hypothetical protein [Polyangiaceae bacterium]